MKTKSTYALLVNANSEEKGRSIFETGVNALVVVCAALSIWTFASNDVTLPGQTSTKKDAPASMIAKAPVQQPVIVSRG